jgi:hypothetical protein
MGTSQEAPGRGTSGVTRASALLGATLATGFVGGAATSLLAFSLAGYGPIGDAWSFRGNGALAAYSVVPAMLGAGSTAPVLRFRAHPAWLTMGLGAGLVGLALAAIDAALLPVFGAAADRAAGGALLVGLAAWTLVSPAVAARIPSSSPHGRSSVGVYVAGAGAWPFAIGAGLLALGLAVPAGS